MGVILDTNWRVWSTRAKSSIPGWTRPTEAQPLWAYQRIAQAARSYRQAGFTAVKLPPSCVGGAGVFSGGYDKYDDYNLDGTAFGDAEQLRQCAAAIHAAGMDVYGDLVLHQYGGGSNGNYRTKRFPKTPTCFSRDSTVGGVPTDPVPDTQGNFPFGDMAAYVASTPKGYMHDGAIAAVQWLTQTADFDGFRLDDTKGTNPSVIWDMLHSPIIKDLWRAGEYFDGNNNALWNWVHGYMQGACATYDFGFKFNVQDICNNNSHSWMGRLANIGYVGIDAANAVTFVESADSDNSAGQQLIWNKRLAYAILLTFPGYPQVYYRDYAVEPDCYGLKASIDNLIWIHENLAQGEFVVRLDSDYQVFAHERLGYGDAPGCVCFFNNDQWMAHTVTVQTALGANQQVHEFTGNGAYNDTRTDGQGRLTVTVPRNNNGQSYLVYARPMGEKPFSWVPRTTTQLIEAAADLPGSLGIQRTSTRLARIEVQANRPIIAHLAMDWTGAEKEAAVDLDVVGPDLVVAGRTKLTPGVSPTLQVNPGSGGWYSLVATGTNLPLGGSAGKLSVTYTGSQHPTPAPAS